MAKTTLPARKETPGQIQARLDIHSGRNAERDAAEEEAIKQMLLERQRAEGDGTASGANRPHDASTNEKLDEEEKAYDDLMVDFEQNRAIHGAVDNAEKSELLGNYFTIFW